MCILILLIIPILLLLLLIGSSRSSSKSSGTRSHLLIYLKQPWARSAWKHRIWGNLALFSCFHRNMNLTIKIVVLYLRSKDAILDRTPPLQKSPWFSVVEQKIFLFAPLCNIVDFFPVWTLISSIYSMTMMSSANLTMELSPQGMWPTSYVHAHRERLEEKTVELGCNTGENPPEKDQDWGGVSVTGESTLCTPPFTGNFLQPVQPPG